MEKLYPIQETLLPFDSHDFTTFAPPKAGGVYVL
jgi:hypothetical protein